MIFTNLKDRQKNRTLSGKIQKCIEFTKGGNLEGYAAGSYEMPQEEIGINIGEYETKSLDKGLWEGHVKYVDVQIMLEGRECIAVNNVRNMRKKKTDLGNDFIEYEGGELFRVLLEKGDVLVLYPEDIHMPGLSPGESGKVRKAVFKINVEDL